MGKRFVAEVLETAGAFIDSLKFAGGSFAILPRPAVTELIELCHQHDVPVSTGGFIEYVLTQGPEAVDQYLQHCKALGFDTVEISSGFIVVSPASVLRLVEKVHQSGMQAKVE